MDIILARVLKYLNGTLFYDDYYKFCVWLVAHYLEMDEDWFTPAHIAAEAGISEGSIDTFIQHLGCKDWNNFLEMITFTHDARLDQIRSRMFGVDTRDIVKDMEKNCSDEEMLAHISTICEEMDKAKRVFIVGALYPMSLAVEFQTDMIEFGKYVVQYESFDPTIEFNEDDLLIVISATGRAMNGFLSAKADLNVKAAKSILVTQNPVYLMPEHKISDYVLQVPGRYDGINVNYQIMKIFDLLRLHYYQQYYL